MINWLLRSVMHIIAPRVCVAGIIRKGDKVLLTRRSRWLVEGDKWCLVGGHVDKGESAENAIRREIKEEIGLNVRKSRFLFYHDEFVERLGVHAVLLVYLVDVIGAPKANWEVSEMKWFSKKEIEKMNLAFTHKNVVMRVLGGKK